jgi:HSP20 family protein
MVPEPPKTIIRKRKDESMLDTTRWDPWQEMMSLREAMNRLLEESVLPPSRVLGITGPETGQLTTHEARLLGTPPLDIQDQNDAFLVSASLPGIRPEDVRIEARGNQVTLSGQIREEQQTERANYLLRERRIGQFSRTFTLPSEVSPEAAQATYANGILTLRLPKSETGRSRQIPIHIQGPQQMESGQIQAPGQDQGQTQTQG